MSRFILFPNENNKDHFSLIAIDDSEKSPKIDIEFPATLFENTKTFGKIKDKSRLEEILLKIMKTNIRKHKSGFIEENGTIISINYDEAIISICNKTFLSRFEKFYVLLRKHGVVF